MNLQYISDSKGKTTGVFIPITQWNELKSKYKGIDEEQTILPQWQKDEVNKRLEDYNTNPKTALDFDTAMADIEKEL